jgi:hemerythrin superfamily protein
MATRKESSTGKASGRRANARKVAADRRGAADSKRGHGQVQGRTASSAPARKAAGARRARATRAARSDAITLLKQDHERVLDAFDRFDRARRDDQKQSLADRICAELTLHAQIEEEMFYPALREALGEEDLVDEAEVEHASAKMLIAQIQRGKVGDPQWDARVKVLGEYVRHHVREEQREIFSRARAARQLDLRELGERIAARKEAGAVPEVRATAAAAVGGDMGNADAGRARAPGFIESAVRTLLPGSGER